MATQAGIGVLIGLGIGSGVTAFLMQRIIRRQDNALQQSLNRLNRMQEDHAQDLNAALEKMAADHEQQLAAKIELYQDTHEEQLRELEAEYAARIAVLTSLDIQESNIQENNIQENTDAATPAIDSSEPIAEVPRSTLENPFIPIPDPWIDSGNDPLVTSPEPEAKPEPALSQPQSPSQSTPVATRPTTANPTSVSVPPKPASNLKLTQKATELGKAAAINRKDALHAIPQLGQLLKDSDADVRLAAVTALHESGSIKAIPFLRQALRDTDGRIVAAASAALSRFKGTKKTAPKAKTHKKKRRR